MFRGFDLRMLGNWTKKDYESLYNAGSTILANHKTVIKDTLDNLVLKDGSLDGTIMQQQWFPKVEADLFISHSHNDKDMAIILAGWLDTNLKVKAFIDSTVWSYCGDLLKILDDKYRSSDKPGVYNYNLRNMSTSHVYLMLSSALQRMIDNTECIFFLNTPQSVNPNGVIGSTSTYSPWIYSEITTTQLIRKKNPKDHLTRTKKSIKTFSDGGNELLKESLNISHSLDLRHLTKIDCDKSFLSQWMAKAKYYSYALDALYDMYQIDGKT
jgi:hypothetical protein